MPASTDPATAGVSRAGEALRFTGALSRASVPLLWKRMPPLEGVRVLDLDDVSMVDSAGMALLAEIASRTGASLSGAPAGLAELRSAYRLDAALGFGAA